MSEKTEKQKIRSSFWEIAVLLLLTAALIVMFTQYCLIKNHGNYSGLPLLDAMHDNFPEYSENTSDRKSAFLTPSFVGILSDGQKRMPTDSETRSNLIRDVRPYILAVLSGSASEPHFASDAAKEAYIERELYGSTQAVYIAFSDEIPAAAIYPLLTGKSFGNDSLTYSIRELFLFCDDSGVLYGTALDCDGTLTVLSVSERTGLSFDTFSAYLGNESMTDFSFARFENGTRRYPVADTSVAYPVLAAYTADGDFLSQNSKDSENILESFTFNPNGTRYYVTRNAYITYVEDMGELRISSDGSISFTGARGNGIPLSNLCERQTVTGSFEDKACAAYKILRTLNSARYGGCAEFCLTSVSYRDGKLTLIFSYASDGIILDDARNAAEFVFSENALSSAKVLCRTYGPTGSTFGDIPGRLLFAVTAKDTASENALPVAFLPVYVCEDGESVYKARYAFTVDRNEYDALQNGENETEGEDAS